MIEKYYYEVSQTKWKGTGPFDTPNTTKRIVVLATDKGHAKKAWRYVYGQAGSGLRAKKLNHSNYNQNMTDRAVRHAEVLLGDWDGV